jgi:formiminotetrahydrofolate cyclodeaminase
MSICVKLPSIADRKFVGSMKKECARLAREGDRLLEEILQEVGKSLQA